MKEIIGLLIAWILPVYLGLKWAWAWVEPDSFGTTILFIIVAGGIIKILNAIAMIIVAAILDI